jgi:hypothetical protein
MARTPDPKLHGLWRDRIRRQAQSGLTIAQFCQRECISRSKFYAWKNRFRIADETTPASTLPGRSIFLPITVRVMEHTSDERLPIEADLPDGIHLRIPIANPHLASHFIRVVARAKTNPGGSR